MKQLSANEFVSASVEELRGVARVTRSAERAPSVDVIVGAFDQAILALQGLDRARFGLLIDLRDAPGRNDAEFERTMASRRSELMRAFRAVAILVKTAVGELQVARIAREDASDAKVFSDDAKALDWLAAQKR